MRSPCPITVSLRSSIFLSRREAKNSIADPDTFGEPPVPFGAPPPVFIVWLVTVPPAWKTAPEEKAPAAKAPAAKVLLVVGPNDRAISRAISSIFDIGMVTVPGCVAAAVGSGTDVDAPLKEVNVGTGTMAVSGCTAAATATAVGSASFEASASACGSIVASVVAVLAGASFEASASAGGSIVALLVA